MEDRYEQAVAQFLSSQGINVHIVNPVQARNFAKGIGLWAKNDRIDAYMLGRMAQVVDFYPTFKVSPTLTTLKRLVIRRFQLVEIKEAERNCCRMAKGEAKECIREHIEYLELSIKKIDDRCEKCKEKVRVMINF